MSPFGSSSFLPRRREIRCFPDCPAQETQDATDCTCAERDAMLYDLECERRIDAERNGDYERED